MNAKCIGVFTIFNPSKFPKNLIRNCTNDSKPPETIENCETEILPQFSNSQLPRVTKIFFSSRLWKQKTAGSHCEVNLPILFKIPILETGVHIFPHFEKLVKKTDSVQSIISSMAPNVKRIGLFAKKEGVKNSQDMNHLYDIGTLASYETWPHNPTESPYVILRSHGKLKRINPSMGKLSSIQYAQCQIIKEEAVKVIPEIRVLCYQIIDFVRRLQPFFPYNSASEELNRRMLNAVYWSYCASDFTMPCEPSRLQTILEEGSLLERLKKTAKVLYEELNFFNISSQMTQKIKEGEIRESYLYNLTRLKNLVDHTIHHYDAHNQKSSDVPRSVSAVFGQGQKNESSFEKKIRERLKELILPANVQTVIDEELSRISSLDKSSLEYGIIQTYLDNLTLVPWGIFSATNTTLSHAQNVLNEDHFGLEEVKDTILEHLAVATRMERSKGRILCFVGPPGVGKTSIVKSIARALNRQYVRISVGGIDDSCEIKGHRRTYIGAMPGKIIKGLQMAKSLDPVFCIDEIDKLCKTHRGDPSGPLLEAFDPEQNTNFCDHFLDVSCDLSRVIFICTANSTTPISSPLLDRMEVIRLSGYTSEEKQEIVKNYIIPSMIKTFNIGDIYGTNITISDEVINRLTDEYFLEAGVRKSKNCVEKICRKALKEIEMGDSSQVHVNLENITDYAGYPDQPIRRPVDNGICGLITGLSASEGYSTGFTLDIECEFASSNKKNGQIESTGLAGKSLSESSIVAFSAAKKVLQQIDSKNKSLDENVTRIHFLEGGVKKDGPSAGVAIFCAVLSQALNVPVSRNLAMTGEITLKGNVMAVGGIREKLTAAIRTGITNVLIPDENIPQYTKLNNAIKSKINIKFIKNVDELMQAAFPAIKYENYIRENKTSTQTILLN